MSKERILLDDLVTLNRSKYHKLSGILKSIIYSKLSHWSDLDNYIEDLLSNAFIVLTTSAKRYDSSKSKFSSYAYNRVIASSKKLYMTLKFPYSGIKALTGKTKVLQEAFLNSNMTYITSIDELDYEIPDPSNLEDLI